MITYRPFLNTDIGFLVEIWRSHHPLRGLFQSMTTTTIEMQILSKPYFDRAGLVMAIDGDVPLGFVHVSFGANEERNDLCHDVAVIPMLMVRRMEGIDEAQRLSIATSLIEKAESYAREAGSKSIQGGGSYPNNPFYLGLYGGSRLPGILGEDKFTIDSFDAAGYARNAANEIWQIELPSFKTVVNRDQMKIRRNYNIRAEFDPAIRSWWEACTLGNSDRTRFELVERSSSQVLGEVTFWDMQPLASHWGVNASGLYDLRIEADSRRQGLATFLIGESLRQLKGHGFTIAEAQAKTDDSASIGLFEKLGFSKLDTGVLFEKTL